MATTKLLGGSNPPSRSNSIEITSESTLSSLRGLDAGMDGSFQMGGSSSNNSGGTRSRTHKQHKNKNNNNNVQADMGRSLNFLNLDQQRRQSQSHIHKDATTVGGASPRLALMQLRLRRLKKTSPMNAQQQTIERLYSSDSALFSRSNSDNKASNNSNSNNKVDQHKGDVWFKSLYPKQGALEKLDEAEAEAEESEHNTNTNASEDAEFNDSTTMNMSGTDLWLFEANQSAPGFLASEKIPKGAVGMSGSNSSGNAAAAATSGDVDHHRRRDA